MFQKVVRLILETLCFVYNDSYYMRVQNGVKGSAFTQVLANIYVFECD